MRYSPDQSRDAAGKFTMGNVATFKNEADGISAHVTSFNGKYHVHLMDDDSGQVLPQSSIHSGDGAKEKAVAHAKKLVDTRSFRSVTSSRTDQRKELKIRTGPMCYRSADGEVIWC